MTSENTTAFIDEDLFGDLDSNSTVSNSTLSNLTEYSPLFSDLAQLTVCNRSREANLHLLDLARWIYNVEGHAKVSHKSMNFEMILH